MICFPTVLLLMCIAGSLSHSHDTCFERMRWNCDHSEFPERFPETTAELRNACEHYNILHAKDYERMRRSFDYSEFPGRFPETAAELRYACEHYNILHAKGYERMTRNCNYSEFPERFPETTAELRYACEHYKLLHAKSYERMMRNCEYSKLRERSPGTTEEYRNACGSIKTLATCILRVKKNCPDEDEIRVEHSRKMKEFIDESCKEDSSIFQVVSDNLQCVADTRKTVEFLCRQDRFSPESVEYIETEIKALIDAEIAVSKEDLGCIEDFLRIACLSSTIGAQCGNATRDVAFEILATVDSSYGLCKEETRRKLETLKSHAEILIRIEQRLREDIEEK